MCKLFDYKGVRFINTIFLIVGKTSSGKDSLVAKLCNDYGYTQLKSYATRPKRINEGNTHTFINSTEVQQYQNQMVAYTKIGDYEYFATKQQLLESDFYIIDYRGIEYMHNLKLDLSDIRFVTIYIKAADEIRETRALHSRSDGADIFYKRCFKENQQFIEMLIKEDFDYVITNNDFNTAYNILNHIVQEELSINK